MISVRGFGLLACTAAFLVSCEPEPCRPRSFGKVCAIEGDGYRFCAKNDESNQTFRSEYVIAFTSCPSAQPMCSTREGTEDPDVICIGERLAPCEQPGFVRCETLEQVVLCVPQEDDTLIESRGSCGEGFVCLPPGAGESDWSGGCFEL